jgi:hypothetical protein
VTVRSIHDCVVSYRLRGHRDNALPSHGVMTATPLLLAAYVNENHPVLDQTITKHALHRPDSLVTQFIGYIGQASNQSTAVDLGKLPIRKEVEAIYDSLQRLGLKYADLGVPPNSAEAANGVATRSVRLVGEIVESRQANALEAATVAASVLRKLSVDTVLFVAPDRRALLGVFLTQGRNPSHLLVLDLQYLGSGGSFDEAVRLGEKAYASFRTHLGPAAQKAALATAATSDTNRYFTIDLEDARKSGVLPIPERR